MKRAFTLVELLVVVCVLGILVVGGLGFGRVFGRAMLESYVMDAVVVALTLVAWVGCVAKYLGGRTHENDA